MVWVVSRWLTCSYSRPCAARAPTLPIARNRKKTLPSLSNCYSACERIICNRRDREPQLPSRRRRRCRCRRCHVNHKNRSKQHKTEQKKKTKLKHSKTKQISAFFDERKHNKCPTKLEKARSSFSPTSTLQIRFDDKKKIDVQRTKPKTFSPLSHAFALGSTDKSALVTPLHPKGNIFVLATQPVHSRNETVTSQPVRNHPIRS